MDLIVANSLREEGAGFQTDTNKIMIIDKETVITGSFLCGAPHKNDNAESIVMR